MTLLETLQRIDVPGCVAWLTMQEVYSLGAHAYEHDVTTDNIYMVTPPNVRIIIRVQSQRTHGLGNALLHDEIDACLAGVG